MNRRGQITIFILLAVVIIAGVVLFFIFMDEILPSDSIEAGERNPSGFLANCVQDKVEKGVELILKQGGYIDPELSRQWEGEEVAYLCYTSGYYVSCINQEPLLIQRLKIELKEYIKDDLKDCFDSYAVSLDENGYEVQARYRDFDIILARGKVIIETDAEIRYTKSGQNGNLENPSMTLYTKYYDLGLVVQEIIYQEGRYCSFENVGYGIFYPEIKVDRYKTSDLDKVYTVSHKKSGEEFKFVVRGCVLPPGY